MLPICRVPKYVAFVGAILIINNSYSYMSLAYLKLASYSGSDIFATRSSLQSPLSAMSHFFNAVLAIK